MEVLVTGQVPEESRLPVLRGRWEVEEETASTGKTHQELPMTVKMKDKEVPRQE